MLSSMIARIFPSPLVGEGGFERGEKPGEENARKRTHPLTRLDLVSLDLATLSHEGRGKKRAAADLSRKRREVKNYAPRPTLS